MRPLDETERAPELKFLSLYEFFPLLDNRACCLSIIGCRHRIDGDTLQHALGLTPFGGKKKKGSKVGKQKLMDAAKRVSHWRWLIIDEVSMISANFLAELDMHLRAIMSQVSITKRDTQNIDRPFGGINILFVGDFHQLDPPTGTPINAIPTCFIKNARKYAPGATEEHGQYFLGN